MKNSKAGLAAGALRGRKALTNLKMPASKQAHTPLVREVKGAREAGHCATNSLLSNRVSKAPINGELGLHII
ncbi:hypothetical protein K443DRAFT_673100 [Laccaria amethystina LaAM-08-1]|uniref:Uncharacterized protein n=1 Tax=Laccaria amethystina LaAM-08-1 TaxID=1095629 RepID=A0A0C9YC12_9AGAR|nr:hypothetical protein K443DRAFT_673100 [Laccaria amethystina LaAM-08-1]